MSRVHIYLRLPDVYIKILDALVESGLYKNRTDLVKEALENYEPIKRLLEKEREGMMWKLLANKEMIKAVIPEVGKNLKGEKP